MGAGRALLSRPRLDRTGLWVLLALYVVARIVMLAGGEVFTSYDTASYAGRGDPALAHPSLVSFTGHAPRLWGVPAFDALFPTDTWRAVAQWSIGTVAWALLAWVIWTMLRHPAMRLAGSAAVLVLAVLPPVGGWDLAILSESLSISLGVLTIAMLLRWLATGSRTALVVGGVVAFWWTFTRPDIRVFTVALIAVLAVIAWRLPARRRCALVAAGALVLAVGWTTAIMPSVTEASKPFSGLGAARADDEWLIYRLRLQVLPDPKVRAVFRDSLGMPSCPAAEAIATRPDWDILDFADAYESCPELAAWGRANRDDVFNRFALAAPGQYLRMTAGLLGQSWQGVSYVNVPSAVFVPVRHLVFPGLTWTLPLIGIGIAVSLAAAVATGARRAHPVLFWAAIAVGAASVVSTLAGVLYGTGEFARFGIQEAIGIRLAVLFLLAIAADEFLTQRAERAAASAGRTTLNVGSHA